MTIGLIALSLLMGAIVWWLFRQSVNVQPWNAQLAVADVAAPVGVPVPKIALGVFLCVASSLFILFVSAYAMRLGFADWAPLPRPRLLAVNTLLLAGASIAMEWTVHAARRNAQAQVRRGMAASGALTIAFVAGQLAVWQQLVGAGYFLTTSAATSFFYLFTAVHGAHVLGGLVAWARTSLRAWRAPDPVRTRLAVELCATYWHFLLVVWLVLYALLVSSHLGLAICSAAPL
jgi:cytochrome c oxidase subunit 3